MIEYEVLGPDQSFLDAFDNLFALQLVMKVSFKNSLAVAFSVKSEVDCLVNVVLVNHSQLIRYVTALDEEIRRFRIHGWEAALRLRRP